ncbi:3-hydroxyacyl-CoA dehydrogenase family protein [Natronomonas salsuginis]|uniref:3-hydroxyacyl-CoA dehydrogenase family protein n=1 Tax=Natronomonas salsuginis TaxID=2217661 RepID=A0A4U5JAL1_9EURY|nr:3-hydroxyacyl-CoA dehydrogenase family protein [Natronomonas salsuginis]TKR26212.1 3-hydroxyacyl-CoA dehydrogenase family protein [Natronomonas salsuginis]
MQIAVLGAGTMGHGIAQVSAMAGHEVVLYDIESEFVEDGLEQIEANLEDGLEHGVDRETMEATLDRLSGTADLEDACGGADLVIEAVPERMELKRDTFSDVEAIVDDDAIIATNTSSLSVTEIASVLDRPERAVGIHFFNPVHIMPIVEVVVAAQTDDDTLATAIALVEEMDKEPAVVRDFPGFASSRLGVTLGVEAMRMVEQGVASPEAIDTVMEIGYNHPMGPLKLTDVVGLDVRLDILEYLSEELGDRFRPPQILKQKVRAGETGKKSGEGFYVWEDGEAVGVSELWSDE